MASIFEDMEDVKEPKEVSSHSWPMYVFLVCVFILLTYVAMQYGKDVKNRDIRSARYNLKQKAEHVQSRMNALENGYLSNSKSHKNEYLQWETSSDEESEF